MINQELLYKQTVLTSLRASASHEMAKRVRSKPETALFITGLLRHTNVFLAMTSKMEVAA